MLFTTLIRSLVGGAIVGDSAKYQLISHLIRNRAFYYRVYHVANTLNNIKVRDISSLLHEQAVGTYVKTLQDDLPKQKSQEEATILYNFLDNSPDLKPELVKLLASGTFIIGNKP